MKYIQKRWFFQKKISVFFFKRNIEYVKLIEYLSYMSIRRTYPDGIRYMDDKIIKIAIIGGGGLLAKEIYKNDPENTQLFTKKQVDIRNIYTFGVLDTYDIIIHTAALIDNTKIKGNEVDFIDTNIVGTANLAKYCILYDKRLVYISTDYVYDGDGPHFEEEPVKPYNLYAWSKLGGETSVKFVPNHSIIRTSFGKSVFPYDKAFENQYVSKDYVDIIAPLVLKVAKNMNSVGVINVGTEKKSVFDYAIKRNPDILPDRLEKDKDFTLNLDKLNNI